MSPTVICASSGLRTIGRHRDGDAGRRRRPPPTGLSCSEPDPAIRLELQVTDRILQVDGTLSGQTAEALAEQLVAR